MENSAKRSCPDPDTVPIFNSLHDFAQGSEVNEIRYKKLVENFTTKYGSPPKYLARAPGRVNLIGEHIDYCGYGVLPMALEQDIAMAFSPNNSDTINVADVEEQYAQRAIQISSYTIEGVAWYNYFLCGFKGIVEEFKIEKPCGMDILTDGSIPPSAGLSSSSALVCCASLVTICVNNVALPTKKYIADLCARSERFIGTQGGGMDQAISFLAEPGQAMMIDFNPLQCTEVSLPAGHCFIIANCGVGMNKAATLSFNERVVECRLATKLLACAKGIEWREVSKLMQVQQLLDFKLQDMAALVKECLHEEPYTKEEICQLLGIPNGTLVENALAEMSPQAKEAAERLKGFKLFQRASHVYQEAYRVVQFKNIANSSEDSATAKGIQLGELMNASHTSCSHLYECSCPELDQLVNVCTSDGALGSRLTGAGWGGCSVSLIAEGSLEGFLESVAANYYKKPTGELEKSLFATKPGPGAALCNFQ